MDRGQDGISGRLKGLTAFRRLCTFEYMPKTISEALHKAIEDSGLNNLQLARLSGVNRPSIIKFRRGERSLRLDMADRIAKALNLELVERKKGR